MAKDRAAGSRSLGEHGFHGLGRGSRPLSGASGRINLAIYWEPCAGSSCLGWVELDNNPITAFIAAGGGKLYQVHTDGTIWSYTGPACSGSSCPGWLKLDQNPKAVTFAAGGGFLYELHDDGTFWQYTGPPCYGNSCPGWLELDNNPEAAGSGIFAGGDLYEQHLDHSIWQRGHPVTGAVVPAG